MREIQQHFTIDYSYPVYFSKDLFRADNTTFKDFLIKEGEDYVRKILFVIDEGMAKHHPELNKKIETYISAIPSVVMPVPPVVLPGGEEMKNNPEFLKRVIEIINDEKIDRHSFVVAVGGGSTLDMVGFASAIAHRGIRHLRIPTTVLSQNDSGVGVKNGINFFGKKNFLGSFSPPRAIFNDPLFLESLDDRNWLSGISEAVKVALVKDKNFFHWLEEMVEPLVRREESAMTELVYRSAQLHLDHIASGDPFEMGSSRPLDFGHWSAHKLEQLSQFSVLHGEAVAIGMALDVVYSQKIGWINEGQAERILQLLKSFRLKLYHPLLKEPEIMDGIAEFREHLGGKLTIMLLKEIGKGANTHTIDTALMQECIASLEHYEEKDQ